MAKKSIIDRNNPALAFISNADAEPEQTETPKAEPKQTEPVKDNAAVSYKKNPLYIEKKTKRVQLVLQPSVYEKAKNKANSLNISLNEYISTLIENDKRSKK